MSEGATDSNNLFNLFNVCVATVDVVSYSGDGGKKGLVGGDIVSEGDGMFGVAKRWWCLNGGIRTWNCWCGWWYVFLIGVIELAGSRFVWVWEPDTGDVGRSVFADLEESCDALLDSGVLLRHAY